MDRVLPKDPKEQVMKEKEVNRNWKNLLYWFECKFSFDSIQIWNLFFWKLKRMKERKPTASKLTPSQLVKKQLTGNGFFEEALQKPRII